VAGVAARGDVGRSLGLFGRCGVGLDEVRAGRFDDGRLRLLGLAGLAQGEESNEREDGE
jgi:hypothetical protein